MIQWELNQTILKEGQRFPERQLKQLFRCVERVAGISSYQVSIAFVSPSVIRRANRLYRKKDCVTDVLSFELAIDQGELLLCYAQAKKQAKEMKHNVRQEIIFLIVHGMFHLFGYDHERIRDAKKMFAMQEKTLKAL